MDERYTSLSWFLCSANPTPKQVAIAKAHCSEHALELQGGRNRSLDTSGFAALPPARPKSLTSARRRLVSEFVNTAVQGFRVRRVIDGKLNCRPSQVLFSVVDLQKAFGN